MVLLQYSYGGTYLRPSLPDVGHNVMWRNPDEFCPWYQWRYLSSCKGWQSAIEPQKLCSCAQAQKAAEGGKEKGSQEAIFWGTTSQTRQALCRSDHWWYGSTWGCRALTQPRWGRASARALTNLLLLQFGVFFVLFFLFFVQCRYIFMYFRCYKTKYFYKSIKNSIQNRNKRSIL